MPDTRNAYALAVQLYQELKLHEHHYPQPKQTIKLADELASELGWEWVKTREPDDENRA